MERAVISLQELSVSEQLDLVYAGKGEGVSVDKLEAAYAEAIEKEAFQMFMGWIDNDRTVRPTRYFDLPCNTFELAVADMTGRYAQHRLERIDHRTTPLATRMLRTLGLKPPSELHPLEYSDQTIWAAIRRTRDYDDVFEPRHDFDIPPARAAAEVTREFMLLERRIYS